MVALNPETAAESGDDALRARLSGLVDDYDIDLVRSMLDSIELERATSQEDVRDSQRLREILDNKDLAAVITVSLEEGEKLGNFPPAKNHGSQSFSISTARIQRNFRDSEVVSMLISAVHDRMATKIPFDDRDRGLYAMVIKQIDGKDEALVGLGYFPDKVDKYYRRGHGFLGLFMTNTEAEDLVGILGRGQTNKRFQQVLERLDPVLAEKYKPREKFEYMSLIKTRITGTREPLTFDTAQKLERGIARGLDNNKIKFETSRVVD